MTLDLAQVSFQEAIAFTASWLEQIVAERIDNQQISTDLPKKLGLRPRPLAQRRAALQERK